jgi:pyruvate kinase
LFGIKHNISYVSLSFARSAKDLAELREFLYKNQSAHVKIIAKIESQE